MNRAGAAQERSTRFAISCRIVSYRLSSGLYHATVASMVVSGDHPRLPFGQNAEADPQRLLSAQELASYLEVPVKTIYTWRHRNTGPKGFRVGKHVRFRWRDVEAWVAERIQEG